MSKHSFHFGFTNQRGNCEAHEIFKFQKASNNPFSFFPRRNTKISIFVFRNIKDESHNRAFHSLRKETNNNAALQYLTPRTRADLFYITIKRRNHTKNEHIFGLGWKELITILGAALGIYFSFLIWGWNFRYESLREFEATYNTEEGEKAQMLLTLFEECVRPDRPSGISDYEYYNLCCEAIVKKYIELKTTNPTVAKEIFSAVHQIFIRFQDGRLLFETLKAFHKIGRVLKTAERVLFDSNTEQLFEDAIVGRYCHRAAVFLQVGFPILIAECSINSNKGKSEEVMSLASWYSSRCNCLQTDILTFSAIQSKHEFYLPTKCEVKTVGVNVNEYLKTVPKHTLSYINFSNSAAENDKEIIAKQNITIKQLEDKCAHLQAELHKSKDLYLYSSLKYLLANKEHREEIMKTHKENTHDLKKKLTKLSASS